jgi:hypothetical protein
MFAAVAVVDVCGAGWPVLWRRLVKVLAGAAVEGRGCGGGWCSVWWLVGVVAAARGAVQGSGGVTGAEPVAGIPGLIPGFVTEAAILMVRTGSVGSVLWSMP